MGTTLDYLQWRGDLDFKKDPFNDIDALILALLSYLPFQEIVPGIKSREDITLKDVSARYFSKAPKVVEKTANFNPTASTSFDSELDRLLELAASCPRFEGVRLSKYEENLDFSVGRQFGAITFSLTNSWFEKVVAFRGTNNSLIGWKEDFELAYMEQTPAQESAYRYLEQSLGLFSGQFVVCGHSKGGNLAMYAGSKFNFLRQKMITKIINFDGPGFDFSVTSRDAFKQSENKVVSYIPEESIVGLLLEPIGKRTVVSSSGRLIDQHNALNWQVERTTFAPGKLSSISKSLNQTIKNWLTDIPLPDREAFLEALFEILGASEGASLKFDPQESFAEIKTMLTKYSRLDPKTKSLLNQVLLSLTAKTRETLTTTIKEKLPKPR